MADVHEKLQHLLGTGGLMSGAQFRAQHEELQQRRASGEFEIDQVVSGEIIGDPDDGFYLVRQEFPIDHAHGNMALGAALDADARHIATSANDEELSAFDPRSAVFVDTETTGLMGGAGTVLFLVGVGYFTETAFRLDQCFMRDYDDEEPMLHYLNDLFANAETLVSYNGKTFDLPLLRTRFITNRVPFRLEGALHFDLVHATRRFWKKRLRDCSLGNIEQMILGIRRQGDVAGAEIPRLWLDYLRTRDARTLVPVFYHHQMDILSLVALTGLLAQKLDAPEGSGFDHHEDRLSLLRLHFRQKKYGEVLALADRLLEDLEDEALRAECLEHAGFASKRTQEWARMEQYWTLLMQESPSNLTAPIELAKHLEHRKRDLPEAERVCRGAIQYYETRLALGRGLTPVRLRDLEQRLERVERKLNRARGGGV